MWDGTPPRQARGNRGNRGGRGNDPAGAPPRRPGPGMTPPPPSPRGGPSGARWGSGPAGAADPANPYRPYGQMGASSRLPVPYRPGTPGTVAQLGARQGIAVGVQDPDDTPAHAHKHIGFAIFHDGNPGHLWRGSVASALGEAVLSAGVVMWLAGLTLSPQVVAFAVAALGLPFLLAGPLGARFENAADPGRTLKWIGRLRILLALALIAMHYHTILPAVYGLLFMLSLCGRLHDALRTAVARTCLAPGELEHVANDMHIGASLAAVIGPLLATAVYALLGERILLVSVAAATIFLLSLNSESFLDTLHPTRRAFLLATPESGAAQDEWEQSRVFGLDDDTADSQDAMPGHEGESSDPEEARELKLPAWYQQGPQTAWQALADIRAGLGLAGTSPASTVALWAVSALSLVGGGLAALEVFYLFDRFGLPSLYLGPLLACESAGLALGALLAGDIRSGGSSRWRMLVGIIGVGAALAALAGALSIPMALAAAFVLGAANAIAVQSARRALLQGFDGIEQRALAASEGWVSALCGIVGALAFTAFYAGVPGTPLSGWPISELFLGIGGGLALSAVIFTVLMTRKPKVAAAASAAADSASELAADDSGDADDMDGEESDYLPAPGRGDAWDESRAGWTGEYDAGQDDYAASYGYQRTGYGPAARAGDGYDEDYNDAQYDDADEYDDYGEPPSRRSPPPPPNRSSRRNPRPRW